MNEAFNKLNEMILSSSKHIAKQYSKEYNINRGELLGINHILSVTFYTDYSELCTDYRSTFRKTNKD